MRLRTHLASVLLLSLVGLIAHSQVKERDIIKICGNDRRFFQTPEYPDPTADPISLSVDRLAKRKIDTAQDYLNAESWPEAIRLLQSILDERQDSLLEVTRKDSTGKVEVRWTSARREAERVLGTFSKQGLDHYQLHCGQMAADRLKTARIRNDLHQMAEVVQRYLYTKAGAEALALLGTLHLDRGRPALAADCFHRLLHREHTGTISPLTLFQAAAAFHQVGDRNHEEVAWQRLVSQSPRGLQIGKEQVPLDRLRKELDRLPVAAAAVPNDWLMFRGNPARSSQGNGSMPYLEPRWQVKSFSRPETERVVGLAQRWHDQNQEPLLPALFPVASGNKIVFRSYAGLHAVDIKTGQELWRAPLSLSYESVLNDPGKKVQVEQWMRMYAAQGGVSLRVPPPIGLGRGFAPLAFAGGIGGIGGFGAGFGGFNPGVGFVGFGPAPGNFAPIGFGRGPIPPPFPPPLPTEFGDVPPPSVPSWAGTMLFSNCVQGTISTDRRRVYAVDDLPMPPPQEMIQEMLGGVPKHFGPLRELLYHNRLRAIDMETGKLTWEVGGRGKGDLDDCYFLGPPLPLNGKLYVLVEREGELRLVCLDGERGDLEWAQPLATYRDKLLVAPRRRLRVTPLSYADGILVCGTNSGVVLGVEVLTRSLLWVHSYRGTGENREPEVEGAPLSAFSLWRTSAPILHQGKVIFTAPDSASIHCLNLREGTALWKTARTDDDLYLAAVHKDKEDDKVMIVGRQHTRALSLKEGKETWKLEVGQPSGQGVASGKVYYLPLKKGAVCAIDMEQGKIVASNESRSGETLGNLIFHEGDVISQTVWSLTAYPQAKVRLAQIHERLAKNARDPIALTDRGALRLDEGNLTGAVTDLRTALANKPPAEVLPRTRAKLYEALTQWLHRDFQAAEKYLDEYHELCRVPYPESAPIELRVLARDEQENRLAIYHAIKAKGREEQGKLEDAMQSYRQLHTLVHGKQSLAAPDDSAVKSRADVWVSGRIAALLAKAPAAERKTIEEQIAREGKEVRAANDLDALARFVALYGSLGQPGREARLELAERLITDRERGRFLEAELHLLQLADLSDNPELSARATEALARLNLNKGHVNNALVHYRTLAQDFARVKVREGKTGAELYEELAADKRFLEHVHATTPAGMLGKSKAVEQTVNVPLRQAFLYLEPNTEAPPSLRPYRLVLDITGSRLKLLERTTGAEVWSQRIPLGHFAAPLREVAPQLLRVPYRIVGHLAVVHLGYMIFGIDLMERRLLWQRTLVDSSYPLDQTGLSFSPEQGWELIVPPNRTSARLEHVSASIITMHTEQGLVGLDPMTGDVLWTRSGIAPGQEYSNDGEHVYLPRNDNGNTLAIRARDGTAIEGPRFPDGYTMLKKMRGSQILVLAAEADKTSLKGFDLRTGKEIWTKALREFSRVVPSSDPALASVLDSEGKLTVVDIRTQKELLQVKVDPKHLDKLDAAHLLHDSAQFYLALDTTGSLPETHRGFPIQNFLGRRPGIPVHGMLLAFDRASGKLNWSTRLVHQVIVQDSFEEVPILVCTAWSVRKHLQDGSIMVATTRTIDKRTGKLLFDKDTNDPSPGNPVQPMFHTLDYNPGSGTVDLIGSRLKIHHHRVEEKE